MKIPQPRFLLKDPKSNIKTAIYCHIRFNRERIIYSTGDKIHPDQWDPGRQRAINSKKYPENSEINLWLDKIDTEIKSIFRSFNIEKITPTVAIVKEKLFEKLSNTPTPSSYNLFQFIEKYIEECKQIKNPNTIRTYLTAYNHLKSFSKHYNQKLNFADITLEFYNKYLQYFTQVVQLSQNTIGKQIQVLKTLLNEATDRGYNSNLDFRGKRFKKPSEPVYSIYLNEDDLKKLKTLDLSDKPNLERVRDLFIVGCLTGLRYSDLSKIQPAHLVKTNEGSFINLQTQKTDERVVIPLHPTVIKIIEKYYGNIPPALSNQKMNMNLKVIGKLAGIDDQIIKTRTKGGVKIKEKKFKFQLLTTHVARKSFATNAFLGGVPTLSIMKITGHRTENIFLKYVKISQEENANNLINHKFFKE